MKIGLFIPNATFDRIGAAEVGGIEAYAFELGEALLHRGHDIVLFGGTPKQGRTHRQTLIRLRLSDYIETTDIWQCGTRFRKLVQRLHFASSSFPSVMEERCEIMIVFKPYDFINAWRWKRQLPSLKVVMNYQGEDFFPTDGFWRRWIDWEYACSEQNATLAETRYGSKPEVIPNGVDITLFSPRTTARDWTPIRLLTAGRLVGWKGLESLMPGVTQFPQVEWHIAGDGPERVSLEHLAETMGCASRVKFHGVLDPESLADLMRKVDFFAQPSIAFDACPTSVLQAMSSGLPVFLSHHVGLTQHFDTATECKCVENNSSEGWAAAIRTATEFSEHFLHEIGKHARATIEKQFAWDKISSRVIAKLLPLTS